LVYGRTGVSEEARSGRPSTSRAQDHIEHAKAIIRKDRRISGYEVAEMLDIG